MVDLELVGLPALSLEVVEELEVETLVHHPAVLGLEHLGGG